ncbi:MAG: dihydropteroate synthase [Gammaproteobacteria bacterium]|nr:dihydropteroate synthase [Gammaproteobacteria bacterium]NNF61110.1 dihydropteroate synthase [Gammaproteobacteria bacterium]
MRNQVLGLEEPVVMGVLNVTPDSFSDGGRFDRLDTAVTHAVAMREQGAVIIDIGGESTRPGADAVPADEEISRVIPVVKQLLQAAPGLVSVDTSKAPVMRAAITAGAHMINDVAALRGTDALQVCADSDVAVCLMHMKGTPRTMQQAPAYDDVVTEVRDFLGQRIEACRAAGIARERIVVDPGFGFGKALEHNLALLRGLSQLCELGQPVLAGLSRKSMLGQLLDRAVDERLAGSLALATLAVSGGASIIRAHDVAATADAVKVAAAVAGAR